MTKTRSVLSALVLLAGCNSTCNACDDQPAATEAPDAGAPQEPAVLRPRPELIAPPPDVGAIPAEAQKTASGLAYVVLTPGTGSVHPGRKDTVTVNQTGWTKAGQMIDSSVSRGQPITFEVDRVIRGWSEMLELMVVGEKCRVWIPATLAYGNAPPGAPGVEQGGTPSGDLVYELELLGLQPAPAPSTSASASASGRKTTPPAPAASTSK
jgi:hypothetical protein